MLMIRCFLFFFSSLLVQSAPTPSPTTVQAMKETYCASYQPLTACSEADWEGVLVDLFSPDDTCPESTRYIDFRDEELEISASGTDDNCNSTWGRRFNSTTSVNPVLALTAFGGPCVRSTSFVSKVPPDSPMYEDAQNGALNFTLVLSTVFGQKMIKWNGVYNGTGGDIDGSYVPPSDCDNFWKFVERH